MNSDIETSGIQAAHKSADYLWQVVSPHGGSSEAIATMNAKLLAYDPNTPAREHPELFAYAHDLITDREPMSIARLFRSIIRDRLSPDVQSTNAHGEKTKPLVGAAQQEKE